MLEVYERLERPVAASIHARLLLDHDLRQKGRLRVTADNGEEVRLFLERGQPLQVGEIVRSHCGKNLLIDGAVEEVSVATAENWLQFSRACYHLGNRHVKVEVGELQLKIKPDHVLEEMLQGLGLKLAREQAVFVPESGAYAQTSHHGHGHHHHDHDHD